MKRIVFLLVLVAGLLFAVAVASKHVLDDDMINAINNDPKSTWKAARNKRFEGMTIEEAHSLLATKNIPFDSKIVRRRVDAIVGAKPIPSSFDARKEWPGCVHPIRDQGSCGSCWAFGATEALSDRFCIASNGKINVVLSPQALVSCDTGNYGCNGGYLDETWQYLVETGVPSEDCVPYVSGTSGDDETCPKDCTNGHGEMVMYKAKPGTITQPTTVAAIQQLIMTSGPVEAAFSVYNDFFSYAGGVYKHTSGALAGGHAIKIVGWGVDSKTNLPYWNVANSWGTNWGMDGFFWILRGKDECGIESNVIAAMPLLPNNATLPFF
eukprot:GEZU01029069.1.p1 GENE.GEZU01029069.1~~GEZU01029069.1.p1  ORF type:complete len:324 (+),score=120.08 GEZU01029069.1:250-1221(+)